MNRAMYTVSESRFSKKEGAVHNLLSCSDWLDADEWWWASCNDANKDKALWVAEQDRRNVVPR